jgi:hypothetical protein
VVNQQTTNNYIVYNNYYYNNSFNKITNVAFDGGYGNKNNVNFRLRSYSQDIISATNVSFSENQEIEVAVDIVPSRLLQS